MKRKGKKSSKAAEKQENGVNDVVDENGEASDREEAEPEEKKRKSGGKGKRKSSSGAAKKVVEEAQEEETQYEVESILDQKNIRGVRHYLIRWKGYEPESDTWEPESTLNCSELIAEFKAKQKKKKNIKPSKQSKNEKQQETWDENENFEVDRILEVHFKKNGKREFLVSWKGYPQSQNTWEPEDNLNCELLIDRFMTKVEKAKEAEQRELRVKRMHTDRFTLSMDAKGRRLSKRHNNKQRVHYHDAE